MFVGKLADSFQVVFEVDSVVVEGLFDNTHGVFQHSNLAVELDQALRQWVLSEHMRVDVITIDWCLALTLVNHFLHLFVLLLKSLDVAINHSNTFLIVIDLVVKNLVMSVDRNFTVD